MLLLNASDLCKQLNGLRGAVAGEGQDFQAWEALDAMRNVLSHSVLIGSLAFGGLLAAFVGVVNDARLGGAHGALFLTVNSLCSLFFGRIRGSKGSSITSM